MAHYQNEVKTEAEVLLINPPSRFLRERHKDEVDFPHPGLGYLAAYLRQHGFKCQPIDAKFERIDFDQLALRLKKYRPCFVGITSMITFILGSLSSQITNLSADQVTGQLSTLQGFFGDGIPTYYFQAVVGIYVVQIVYILTVLSNGIENGADRLQERYLLGNNLLKSTVLYCIIAGLVMLIFNLIASRIIDVAVIVT